MVVDLVLMLVLVLVLFLVVAAMVIVAAATCWCCWCIFRWYYMLVLNGIAAAVVQDPGSSRRCPFNILVTIS